MHDNHILKCQWKMITMEWAEKAQSIPGIPINDPSGPAALGFNTGLISLFIS